MEEENIWCVYLIAQAHYLYFLQSWKAIKNRLYKAFWSTTRCSCWFSLYWLDKSFNTYKFVKTRAVVQGYVMWKRNNGTESELNSIDIPMRNHKLRRFTRTAFLSLILKFQLLALIYPNWLCNFQECSRLIELCKFLQFNVFGCYTAYTDMLCSINIYIAVELVND